MDEDKTIDIVFKKAPIALSTDKITVKQNEDLVIKLENASDHNGKTVVFWLNSDPIKLGEATVTDGAATFTAKVPCGVKPGDHTVTAEIDGNPVGTPVPVTVLFSPTCPVLPSASNTGQGQNLIFSLLLAIAALATGITGLFLVRKKQQ